MTTQAKSWPFQEARSLLAHIEKKGKKPGDIVTFETGYGPSGAPHIGTFGEVVRTLWVMRAFDELTESAYKTRLIMFSDDYDALRKVPDGLPAWMEDYKGFPLSSVRSVDPLSSATFGHDNNMKLIEFVDNLLEKYDGSTVGESPSHDRISFVSSTEYYKAGKFNDLLARVFDNYDAIQSVMLPTLGDDRRATYSPFMPVLDSKVHQEAVALARVSDQRFLEFTMPTKKGPVPAIVDILDGRTKLQWKVDWAMRWVHFDVDYEMSGKDLIDSVKASSKICRILGGIPPLNMTYELFLDENGEKISKSKGNGFTIEQWLELGSEGSLMLFMFQNPKAAKKLYRDLVPKMEDDFLKMRQKESISYDDPLWHFYVNTPRPLRSDISYGLLLNLAIVCQPESAQVLISYLEQNRSIGSEDRLILDSLATRVLTYARDKGLFNRACRAPSDMERKAFSDLARRLDLMFGVMDAELFQYQVYEVGKLHGFDPLRGWFQALYECFLGSSDGPRFGVFAKSYGLTNTVEMLRKYERV